MITKDDVWKAIKKYKKVSVSAVKVFCDIRPEVKEDYETVVKSLNDMAKPGTVMKTQVGEARYKIRKRKR